MSRVIAIHVVVAASVFVAAGTVDAEESNPGPALVESRDTRMSTGVLPTENEPLSPERDMRAAGVPLRLSCVADVEERQNCAKPCQDASGSSQGKPGKIRRWLAGAMTKMLAFLAAGLVSPSGR